MSVKNQSKESQTAKIIDFSTKTEKKCASVLLPPFDHAAKYKKAATAIYNARHRCKHSAAYSGIKVLFENPDHLIADIGLPKKPDVSLDRINPHGHYEPGNVRWASSAVQAVNKKQNSFGSMTSLEALTYKYKSEANQEDMRRKIAQSWDLAIDIWNRGWIREAEAFWFRDNSVSQGIFEANFDVSTIYDPGNTSAGIFHLPSLTVPGARIRLRGGPMGNRGAPKGAGGSGVIQSLVFEPLQVNLTPAAREQVVRDVNHPQGVMLVEQHPDQGDGYSRLEGLMMATAARVIHIGHSAAIFPVLTILGAMSQAGSSWKYGDNPALRAHYLFIPDYQIDQGAGFELKPRHQFMLADLLEMRYARGLVTWVGVQNPHKLPELTKKILLGRFKVRKLSADHQIAHPAPSTVKLLYNSRVKVGSDRYDLAMLSVLDSFQALFKGPVAWGK